jgi:GAF domain-containing protein
VAADQPATVARVRPIRPGAGDGQPAGTVPLGPDAELAFRVVTGLAQGGITAAAGAGISLLQLGGGPTTRAATALLVTAADELQYQLDDGPCLSAWRSGEVVRVPDVRADRRWPGWTAAAADLGVGAVLSVPLEDGGADPGSLNVYAGEPGAFDDRDERWLRLLARAATALATDRPRQDAGELGDRFRAALRDRDVISTAKGVLMDRHGVDEETALHLLLETSRASGARLREVASDVVHASVRLRP